jgi:LmbE family N-acetylglucosaminyl deacetylase
MDADCLDGFDSVAERRVSELRCAAGILGLSGVHFLNYRDSGMPGTEDDQHPQALINAPLEEVAGHVVHYIRALKPQVVITFDPIGGYKHPDHIAIHKATVRAFQLAGDPDYPGPSGLPAYQPQKLYYSIFPKRALRWAVRILPLVGRNPRHFGRNGDIDLVDLVEAGDFPAHARIDYRSVQDKREAASACHASQLMGPARGGLVSRMMRLLGGKEIYMRAYPAVEGRLKETDLFAEVS